MKTPETVAEHLAELLATEARNSFMDAFNSRELSGDSPIEQMMAAALLYATLSRDEYGDFGGSENVFASIKRGAGFNPHDKEHGEQNYRIVPQWKIGAYTVDFLVVFEGVSAVVECDGHDYHERTKEQAEHDRKRDRYLQSQGHLVLRFTGREIYRDAVECATDVLNALWEKWYARHAA